MKTSIELSLKTREVYKLFERKINGDQLFIDTILYKFNKSKSDKTSETYHKIENALIALTTKFNNETSTYSKLLAQKMSRGDKKINFIDQFHPVIEVTNKLGFRLIEFIESYDRLIALIKLLNLADCFESNISFYSNLTRAQKSANQILSHIIMMR